jgi:hypothetical protein
MSSLRPIVLAVVASFAILVLSASAARCQGVTQLIPGKVCWIEHPGTASVRLFAEHAEFGILELFLWDLEPLVIPDPFLAGWCGNTHTFPLDYEIYLVGYSAEGTPSAPSNRRLIEGEPS